jgi:uncharacterized membrane protein YeaQ/YmgE (transglycosylase-associated protein family)
MFHLLIWGVFGLLVGLISKAIHPGDEPIGFLPTIFIGMGGSFLGGLINYLLGMGSRPFAPSGFLMSIAGGVICCMLWRWHSLQNSSTGPKSFFTGKHIR